MIKKIFKILAYFILGLVIALAAAPYVFKDKIQQAVKDAFADSFNAKIDFKDVDITLFRTFPNLGIRIIDLSVTGIDTFDQIDLLETKLLSLQTDLTPLFNKNAKPEIRGVKLVDAKINLLVYSDGQANWDITKSDSSSSTYTLNVSDYSITNGTLRYDDRTMPLVFTASGIDHQGEGVFSSDIFDLDTKTTASSMDVIYGGVKYLSDIKASLTAKINVNLPEEKYTLMDNVLRLNDLDITGEGFVQFVEEGIKMNVKAKTMGENFKNFMSVLPILKTFNSASATGTATLLLETEGLYNGDNHLYPAFNVNVEIANGTAQHESLPKSISNIFAKMEIHSTRPDMKDLVINIPSISMKVGKDQLNGSFLINHSMTAPLVKGKLQAQFDLSDLKEVVPMETMDELKGKMEANLEFDAKMSDIDAENFNAIAFNGFANATDIEVAMRDQPKVKIDLATMKASPKELKIQTQGISMGSSNMNFTGSITNPLAYFSKQKNIIGEFKLDADQINFNEWLNSTNSAPKAPSQEVIPFDAVAYQESKLMIETKIGKIIYGEHVVNNFNASGNLGMIAVDVNNLSADFDGSDIKLSGRVSNIMDFLLNDGMLTGNIKLFSNQFDANQFMINSDDQVSSESELSFEVPKNIDLTIDADLKNVTYTNLELTNLKGMVEIRNEAILFQNMNARLLGGDVTLDGLYSTSDEKPEYNVKLGLQKIDFHRAYENFLAIKALAPISKYIQGYFNTTLVMDGKLNKGFELDYTTLNASGLIETLDGVIKDAKPINDLGEKLGIEKLKNLNLENTKNWFEIKNGYVEIKPFNKNIDGVKMMIGGRHQITGSMDYTIEMEIPRELLKKNAVTGTLNKGLGLLESEASKIGVNIAQGEYIKLLIKLGGSLSSPTIKLTPVGTSGKSFKDELSDEVDQKVSQAKDSLKTVINDKKNAIEDSLKNVVNSEIDKTKAKAQEKTNEIIDEAKSKVVTTVKTQVDTLLGQGKTDSLTKKAEEILKDKSGKEIDDIKDKIKDWNPFKKKKGNG